MFFRFCRCLRVVGCANVFLLTELRIVSNILCLKTKVIVPNIKEKVEMNSKTSFLVEKLVKQVILVVLEGHL